jgi:hypothetical protein
VTTAARSRLVVAIAAALCLLLAAAHPIAGTGKPRSAHVPRADATRTAPFTKVAVVFLENRSYGDVIGSPQAPYINGLARRGALATHYYAVAHPSLPNYLALTTGSTLDITSDCNSCDTERTTLATQLDHARIPWRAYFQAIPYAGYDGRGGGNYTKHYNPFAYSERTADGPSGRRHVVSFARLRRDLATHRLPRFSWIAPDLANDGHNGSVGASDRYLSRVAPSVLRALGPRGVLFITWDEGHGVAGPAGGHIALIAAGRGARHAVRVATPSSHYALLATLESGLRLPALGHAADRATPLLSGLLQSPRPRR